MYLPPLGRGDIIGGEDITGGSVRRKRSAADTYIQEDYLAPRVRNTSRRFRGNVPSLEPLEEEVEEEQDALGKGQDALFLDNPNVPSIDLVRMSPSLHAGLGFAGKEAGAGVFVQEERQEGCSSDSDEESSGSLRINDSPSTSGHSSECDSGGTTVRLPWLAAHRVGGPGDDDDDDDGEQGQGNDALRIPREAFSQSMQGSSDCLNAPRQNFSNLTEDKVPSQYSPHLTQDMVSSQDSSQVTDTKAHKNT